MGRQAQGQELIDDVDAKFAKAREQHPEFKGKEAVVVDAGSGEVFAFTSGDPRGPFLKELGFSNPPAIDQASKDGYEATTSDERQT
jgi:iron complex transport system substrate-binding protein